MLFFGNVTRSGTHIELDDAGNGQLERNTWHGHRFWHASSPAAPVKEVFLHDKQSARRLDTSGWAPELEIVINRYPNKAPSNSLVVFEYSSDDQPNHNSATAWIDMDTYEAGWYEIIRVRCSWQHQQPTANQLLKMLFGRAQGKDVPMRKIEQKFDELGRVGCPPDLMLAIRLTFLHGVTGQTINRALSDLHTRAA